MPRVDALNFSCFCCALPKVTSKPQNHLGENSKTPFFSSLGTFHWTTAVLRRQFARSIFISTGQDYRTPEDSFSLVVFWIVLDLN
jgi:hypothetical protein